MDINIPEVDAKIAEEDRKKDEFLKKSIADLAEQRFSILCEMRLIQQDVKDLAQATGEKVAHLNKLINIQAKQMKFEEFNKEGKNDQDEPIEEAHKYVEFFSRWVRTLGRHQGKYQYRSD